MQIRCMKLYAFDRQAPLKVKEKRAENVEIISPLIEMRFIIIMEIYVSNGFEVLKANQNRW